MIDKVAERILGLVAVDDQPRRWTKIRAAWVVVSLHVGIRLFLALWFAGSPRWLLPLPVLLFAAGMWPRLMRPAAVVLSVVQLIRFGRAFPDVSNHYLVECLSIMVFAAVDLERDDEQALCLHGLRWLCLLVFLMSGVQKMLHGAYFHGQYLAYMVGSTERFRGFFGPIVPAAEVARMQELTAAWQKIQFQAERPLAPLPGPFRIDSLPFVLVSNSVWLGELLLPIGLMWRRVRPLALAGALLLMAAIVASSWEFFFDTLFLNLLLLFARGDLILKLLPLSLISYGYYLLVGVGVLNASFVW